MGAAENILAVDGNVVVASGQQTEDSPLAVFYLNSSQFLVQDGYAVDNGNNEKRNKNLLSKSRINKFLQGISNGNTFADTCFDCVSIHRVTKNCVSNEDDEESKSFFLCDCIGFQDNGWYCSHVIAAMDTDGVVTLYLIPKL